MAAMQIIWQRADNGLDTNYTALLDPDRQVWSNDAGMMVRDPAWVRQWTYGSPPEDPRYPREADNYTITADAWRTYDGDCVREVELAARMALDAMLAAEAAAAAPSPDPATDPAAPLPDPSPTPTADPTLAPLSTGSPVGPPVASA